uniref:Si:ch73-347e22.4 n=1 Tax=Cyprinus carpio TaxID=7962 RepID=A0A8C1T0V9_CYPCA
MDGELPPWNKHGSHNSRVPYATAGEHQQEHDVIGDSFAAGEPMTPLSSCMSGAFKALLPDYHGTSSTMLTNSDKYSYSPDNHCLIKPDTAVDEKIAVERREESDFFKDPLGEALAGATHMLPLRCAQYVTHEKNREVDQKNGNWTSVIKDALEMSNGMEMEQTLSMDERGPLMDYNPIHRGPETEANFTLKDHYQIAGSKLNEKMDGQGVKEESDSFISMLSDDISKNKDVLEMGKHEEPSMLDVGSSLGKKELGITGIREHELGLLPGFNTSSYTPFSSSESLMKSEQFPGNRLHNQSVDHTLQGTTQQCGLSCKGVSPRKTASTNTGFKHAEVNNETVLESSTVYGLHRLDLQKDCHQAEVTDGESSVNSQDHSSQHNVQDEKVKTSNPHVSETTVIKQNAAYLPNSQYFGSKLKRQVYDLVSTPASVGSQNTAEVECENVKLRIPTEENSLPVPGKIETNDFQETSINTKTELSLKVETKFAPEIPNSSSVSETVPDLPVVSNRIHTDYKCRDAQFEPVESGKLNELCFQESNSKNVTLTLTSSSVLTQRTADECDIHVQEKQTPTSPVLLPFNENVKNSERSEKVLLNITSESSIPSSTENVQEAPPSPTSRTDCSSQHNLQKELQRHKKARKRKQSELEALKGPIHKFNKRDDCSIYGSEVLDSAVKLDTTGCEKANQNVLLADHDSTAPKEDLITYGDVNPPAPRKKCRMAQLELLADTAESSQKPDQSCSEATREEVASNARINRKAVSRKKLKKKTKNSASLGNQCSSQSTVLSPEEDCTSHFPVSDTTPMKGVSNPTVLEHATSSLESIQKKLQKSRKKATTQTLQSKDDPHKDVPPTFSEVEADMDVKGHQKLRRFPLKACKGKNRNATSLLNRQSSQDSEGQTDSVSTSVTESLKTLSPQNNPKKSKQKKRAHINKSAKTSNVCPQEDMEIRMTPKTKTVKAKSPLRKAIRTDDNETTLLDTQPSTATAKQPDSVSNVGNEVESPVILSTPRKSQKKKLSQIKCEAIHIPVFDQTTAQQSVLNALSESDVSIVEPTTKRFRTRKKLDKKVSHNTVGENCEPAHMTLSSIDSVYATETDYSGSSHQNTENTSSKRRKTDIKFMEAQSSTTTSSIVVSNPEETVKDKGFSRNKTSDNHLNGNLVEETSLLATVMQESSILPTKIDSSRRFRLSSTLKKPRKKTVTKIKNEAAEILGVNQQEDPAAVPSKSGANIVASSSQMTLKEKRTVEKAIRQEIKDDHSVALFKMQASTLTLKQTECSSTSVHSTAKISRKMSDIKHEAVHTPAADQTMQQEIHPFDSISATEMDHSDVLKQKKTKVKMKKQPKKATKCKTHITQAISDIREQSTVQQENLVSNRNTNSRSEDMTKKCKKKRTSALEVRNDQPEDVVLPPPVSQSKDATQDPCVKTDNVNETAESHVENQVSITTKDVASPQSSLKKAKKTQRKQLLEQKEENEQSNILELAHREDKMSDLPSVVRGVASENFETVSCDQHIKVAKKKSKKSMEIAEAHGFTSVSLSQENNTGSDEAGVMVTVTQVADLCKLSDSQTVGSQQPEKDDAMVDFKATNPPKKRGRKPGRKKRKMACLLTQTIKEEEHKDICYDNRTACDFKNNTQIQTSDIPEEPVLKSRKSTWTQKINSGPVVENLLTQGKSTVSLDITGCHTTLGETLSNSMQTADCEDRYTVEKKPRRRGRPPSKKGKKQKLFVAHLEDNTSPSVQISDLSPCPDSTESTVKAAASPIKQEDMDKNVIVTKQLGTDPSESLQSANDPLSPSIPTSGRKKGKNPKRPIRDPKLTSLRVSSRTSVTSVTGFQKADITSLLQNSTNVFNEEGKTSLPISGTVKKQKLCEKNAIQDGSVLADKKIDNKATIKVLRGRKRGRKRRKIKDGQLQRLKTQDCCEPAKGLLTKFSMTSKCLTEDQNNILTPEKNDIEKTKSDNVEMITPITAETCKITPKKDILCSSPSDLSSNLMKEVKKCKVEEHSAFEVSVQSCTDNTGVSRGICNLISSNVVKEESELISLDTKMKPNIELKCTQEADALSVETSGEKVLDNPPEPENAFQPSTEWKEDSFTQDSEDCVVMPNKVTNNRTIRSKPKEIVKKPLTCKYCGVSFRHITAYTIHQRVHTGDKPYKCKICGKTFSQLSKLKSHHNVHKQDTSFPCPCCSRRFLQKDDLLCHFKVHLQESQANSGPQKHIKSKRNTSSNVSSETPNNCGCLIRKKNFVKRVKLQDHMQVHEVEKPLTCKDCGKTFLKESSLIAHEKTHWPVKPYACSICGKGFNKLKALKKHSQDHAGETPFSCFHCGRGFSALSALRMHQASKTCIARKNDEASSNIEGFIVSQGVDGQVNTPVFFKCQICKQLFRKWCQYTLHLQTHTSSPPYICFSCGQCYETDSEMNVHCEVCCQSSGEEKICGASLAEILQSVTQIYPLKCTSSQSLPSTGFQLNSQTPSSSEQLPQLPRLMDVEPTQTRDTELSKLPKTYSAHSPIKLPNAQSPARSDVNCTSPSSSLECIEITRSIWKFKCSRCGQRFERYRDLSAHLQTHAPGFRYTCAHCGQFFGRWSKLWLHQQRHRLKSRCYSCTQCNLQFRFFSSFREHMIDHARQRPYACPLCPKTFIQEASLHAHQCESHRLCKSLKCDVCSKTFSSLRNLIKHSLLHNGSTSHICLLCNLSFTNTRVLKEHLKTHTTHHGPALPDIPSKPLDFPHKCKRCKASFSTGDLLYAHQIRHSRDAKTYIRPAVLPTSKLSDSCCNDTSSSPPSTHRNHISNLKLDGIPNDDSLYVYSHPDKLYVSPSHRVQLPVINLDPDEPEVSDSQNPGPEIPNSEITSQSDSTHLPQATSDQETTNLNSSESIKMMANGQHNYSLNCQRSPTFVETSVDMEVEQPTQEEESEESFECADCTEKLTSVLGLYEHYILHAMGDAYVQVH